jgi:hypothetical protein
MSQVVLYMDVNFQGASYAVPDGQSIPALPPPIAGSASSLTSDCQEWFTLWESQNYDGGNDSAWIQTPGPGKYWSISNFVGMYRPHGSNNWNDLFNAISFSGPPSGDADNQIWLYADGHYGGNTGLELFLNGEKYADLLSTIIKLKEGPMPSPKAAQDLSRASTSSGIKFKLSK